MISRWFKYKNSHRRDIPVTPRRFFESLYCLVCFTLMVILIAMPVTLLLYLTVWNKRRRLWLYHLFLCGSARLIIKMLPRIDFTVDNPHGETFKTPAVITCNHQAYFDLMCLMALTPRLIVLTNNRVWRNPLYGWIIRLAEFFPVTNGIEHDIDSIRKMVSAGYSVVVFPEGTRSPECRILRFHTGAFHLADKLGLDILPIILHGVGHCLPKDDGLVRPGHMYLEIMSRIKVKPDGSSLYIRKLTNNVRSIYLDRFDEIRQQRETAQYFKRYLIDKYRYIKGINARNVSRILESRDCFGDIVNKLPHTAGLKIRIFDTTPGICSWTIALARPGATLESIISDTKMLETACSTPAIPARLTFVQHQSDFEPDITIRTS